MQLLEVSNTGSISFTRDLTTHIPPYAILSHTWAENNADEVTYADLVEGVGDEKPGYAKIQFCTDQTRKDSLKYFWIDTCCINKSNSSELSEAITSMFHWYRQASKCYVFLSDVVACERDHTGNVIPLDLTLRKSKWFSRGWTLQELLAPPVVQFYSREGFYLGDKEMLAEKLHEISTIPVQALRGSPLDDFSIKERFRWARLRQTSKKEDKAYCLQGIFSVYILPNYGEREHAFQRLLEAIAQALPYQLDRSSLFGMSEGLELNPVRAPPPTSRTVDINPLVTNDEAQKKALRARWESLLASLKFGNMGTRRSTISEHLGLFWIYGKPGAGKSTALKFVYDQARKDKLEDEIVISFFFNARGDILEKSTLGLYRSILHQLLSIDISYKMFAEYCFSPDFPAAATDGTYDWTASALCEILQNVVIQLLTQPSDPKEIEKRTLKLFIDALDECTEPEVQDMVWFLEDLGKQCVVEETHLRVCFTTRYYPIIDTGSGIRMNLDRELGHQKDIAVYIQRYLRSSDKEFNIQEVQRNIQERADGVFLWVWLVVDILSKEIKNGRLHSIQRRLQQIPRRLSDLFKEIMLRDNDSIEEFKFCLQLILFAKRPLTCEEFYHAMLAGTDPDSMDATVGAYSRSSLSRFLLSVSKGLAQLTESRTNPTVQFIHESVKDFLLKEKGSNLLWSDLDENLEYTSHDKIRKCCEVHLRFLSRSGALYTNSSPDSEIQAAFSFVTYATRLVLYHANRAAHFMDYNSFLKDFDWVNWIGFHNKLANHDHQRFAPTPNLPCIFAHQDCVHLLTLSQRFEIWERAEGDNFFDYIFSAAIANSSRDVAIDFLKRSGVSNRVADELFCFPWNGTVMPHTVPIVALCHEDNVDIVTELLMSIPFVKHSSGESTPRESGVSRSDLEDILVPSCIFDSDPLQAVQEIRLIMECVARLGQKDRLQRILDNALQHGAFIGETIMEIVLSAIGTSGMPIIEVLLSHRLTYTVISHDSRGISAQVSSILIKATEMGISHTIIVQLMENSRKFECLDLFSKIALSTAIYSGQHDLLRLLLQSRILTVSSSACSWDDWNPLFSAAVEMLDVTATRLLLAAGTAEQLRDTFAVGIWTYMAYNGCQRAIALWEAHSMLIERWLLPAGSLALWWLFRQLIPASTLPCEGCRQLDSQSVLASKSDILNELYSRLTVYNTVCLAAQSPSSSRQSGITTLFFDIYQRKNGRGVEYTALDLLRQRKHDEALRFIDLRMRNAVL